MDVAHLDEAVVEEEPERGRDRDEGLLDLLGHHRPHDRLERPGTSTGSSPGTASPRRMEAALLTPPGPALRRRASSRIF